MLSENNTAPYMNKVFSFVRLYLATSSHVVLSEVKWKSKVRLILFYLILIFKHFPAFTGKKIMSASQSVETLADYTEKKNTNKQKTLDRIWHKKNPTMKSQP